MIIWALFIFISSINADKCKLTNINCLNSTSYQLCYQNKDGTVVFDLNIKTCPLNYYCDDNSLFPCVQRPVPPPVIPTIPHCTGAGNFSGPRCDQYYECHQNLWWWNPTLKICPLGTYFDQSSNLCLSIVDCTPKKSDISITPPICKKNSRHTGPRCDNFFICTKDWWKFRWNRRLIHCPPPLLYNSKTEQCIQPENSDCKVTPVSTTSTTASFSKTKSIIEINSMNSVSTTVKSVVAPNTTTPFNCIADGKYPAIECNQYYECTNWYLFGWDLKVKNCSENFAFDLNLRNCSITQRCGNSNLLRTNFQNENLISSSIFNNRLTSTSSNFYSTSTMSTRSSFSLVLPTSMSFSSIPTTMSPVPLNLSTLKSPLQLFGLFSNSDNKDETKLFIEKTAIKKNVVCNGPARYAMAICNQYEECVLDWWEFEWKIKIQKCKLNYVFNPDKKICVPQKEYECKN